MDFVLLDSGAISYYAKSPEKNGQFQKSSALLQIFFQIGLNGE